LEVDHGERIAQAITAGLAKRLFGPLTKRRYLTLGDRQDDQPPVGSNAQHQIVVTEQATQKSIDVF
jgi:hypothetical protein